MTKLPLLAFLLMAASATAAAAPRHDPPVPASAATVQTLRVMVNGHRIGYRKLGSGKPLVMLNRFRGTLDTWDPAFLDALASRRSLYVVDFPGIGYSQGIQADSMQKASDFVAGFVDALDLDGFAILGWSWGGLAAQSYYLDHPGQATHAILLATNPPGELDVPLHASFLERALKPVNDLADEEVLFFEPVSDFSRAMAKASRERIRTRPAVDERIPSTQEQFQPYFAAAEQFHKDAEGRRELVMQGPLPVLVIAGDHDNSTAGQNWFPFIGKMRNARFVFYSETGHAPHHQYPEEVAKLIGNFLEDVPEADSESDR